MGFEKSGFSVWMKYCHPGSRVFIKLIGSYVILIMGSVVGASHNGMGKELPRTNLIKQVGYLL